MTPVLLKIGGLTISNLIESPELYRQIAAAVECCVNVHAVYAPGSEICHPEWYLAAVDVHQTGQTYKVYFTMEENNIKVQRKERWFFG